MLLALLVLCFCVAASFLQELRSELSLTSVGSDLLPVLVPPQWLNAQQTELVKYLIKCL